MERLPRKKENKGVIRTIANLAVKSFTQPFASHGEHTFPKNHAADAQRAAAREERYQERLRQIDEDAE